MKYATHFTQIQQKYLDLQRRIQDLFYTEKICKISYHKRQQLVQDYRQAYSIIGVLAIVGAVALPMQAQIFCEQTGSDNPFDNVDVLSNSSPQLIDYDGDGDLDLIVGWQGATIVYYENDGNDNYTRLLGAMNPFDGIDAGTNSNPQLIDFDGDGDLDLISGNQDGTILYYENDGSGNYTPQTGTANPFDGIDVDFNSAPQLIDYDNDGDLDLVVGEISGVIRYYENDGSGNYAEQTGTSNPFDGINIPSHSTPHIVDVDGDGDLDVLTGTGLGFGNIYYIPNDSNGNSSGTSNNPFNSINATDSATPQFIDVDGDGDLDLIFGNTSGQVFYYENIDFSATAIAADCDVNQIILQINSSETTGLYNITGDFTDFIGTPGVMGVTDTISGTLAPSSTYNITITASEGCSIPLEIMTDADCLVPIELLHFQAKATNTGKVQLDWATSSELNNSHFLIQRSADGKIFETIGKIQGAGTTIETKQYAFIDKNPLKSINYYRLQQFDYDNIFEYSDVQVVNFLSDKATLDVFPIPAKDKLFYQMESMEDVRALHLFDMLGRHVLTDVELGGELDISALPKGQYLLVLEGDAERVHRLVQKQ